MSHKKRFFISYRSVNRPQIERLAQDITALGHEAWYDRELTGGQAWWDQIMDQVRACDYVIAALSPDVVKSKPCTEERNYARQLGKTILPVIISSDVIISHFEPELGQIQAVTYSDLDDKSAGLALARAISQLPEPTPLPDPIPPQPPVPANYLNNLREKVYKRELSYQEQSAILGELKRSVHEFDNPADIIPLVEEFVNRPDISVQINQDTRAFLHTLQAQTATATPSPSDFDFPDSAFEPQTPPARVYQPKAKNEGDKTGKWSDGAYYGLMALGFFIPIIGIVVGLYGMFVGDPPQVKKNQGRNILVLSIVMIIVWNVIFTEIANSYYYW